MWTFLEDIVHLQPLREKLIVKSSHKHFFIQKALCACSLGQNLQIFAMKTILCRISFTLTFNKETSCKSHCIYRQSLSKGKERLVYSWI